MTIVHIKNGKEATAEECLIQQKFFCLSSLECLCNAAYPIYDKDYIKTLLMKARLKDKVITNIYFTEEKEPHKTAKIFTSMDIEEMQRLLFPNHSIQDIPYEWAEWDKLYREAVIILKEWNEAEKVKQEQENKHEKHDDMISYMNAVYDANKIVATPPCEIFNRVAIIPNLAISIEDLVKVLDYNTYNKLEIQKLNDLIDKVNEPIARRAINKNNSRAAQASRKTECKNICLADYKKNYKNKVSLFLEIDDKGLPSNWKKTINVTFTTIAKLIYNNKENFGKGPAVSSTKSSPPPTVINWIKEYEAEEVFKTEFPKLKKQYPENDDEKLCDKILHIINNNFLFSHVSHVSRLKKVHHYLIKKV